MNSEYSEQADRIIADLLAYANNDVAEYLRSTAEHVAGAIKHTLDGDVSIDDLEGTAKTGFGVAFQKRQTRGLGLPSRISKKKNPHNLKLDTFLGGYHVDIKTTLGGNTWMVPPECHGFWMLLVKVDWRNNQFSVGLLPALANYLTNGFNRDKKNSVSAEGRENIVWIGQNVEIAAI